MKQLLQIAGKIKDPKLRKMVVDMLEHPSLSGKSFPYPAEQFRKIPASLNWHHAYEGGLVDHTHALALLCIRSAETIREVYGAKIDFDALIAGALLHDIAKVFSWKKGKAGWEGTDCSLDHTMLGTAELYARGFPEKVVHIVASHFGQNGPTPPQTLEALIVHYMDSFDAILGTKGQEDIVKMLLKQMADQKPG